MSTGARKILLAWLAIVLGLYAVLEFFFLDYANRLFPLSSLGNAGSGAVLLVQYSKRGTYPENYVAIFGDSYAYGQGDWLLENEHRVRPTFSPAQLLHTQLQRDVIAFGLPASDSMRANNILPATWLAWARATNRHPIQDPQDIIVYFYEGNDLDDNVEVYRKKIASRLAAGEDIHVSAVAQRSIRQLVDDDPLYRQAAQVSWCDHLFLLAFARTTIRQFYERQTLGHKPAPWKVAKPGTIGQVRVGGRDEFIPNGIQTPALALDRSEIDLGLYLFRESLAYLKTEFPKAHVGVAYIPSVATPYGFVSQQVDGYYRDNHSDRGTRETVAAIRPNSDYICSQVRKIAADAGAAFVDPRAHLRAVAKDHFIHGPIDWHHFNRLGYETFTQDLVNLLDQMDAPQHKPLPNCSWE